MGPIGDAPTQSTMLDPVITSAVSSPCAVCLWDVDATRSDNKGFPSTIDMSSIIRLVPKITSLGVGCFRLEFRGWGLLTQIGKYGEGKDRGWKGSYGAGCEADFPMGLLDLQADGSRQAD